jgi:hypothetical protein
LKASAIPNARVVAKFDSGDPALLEVPVGKGRVLALTSGWNPDDSQLALSSKFVPLVYSALDYSGAAAPPPAQYFVGDTVPLTLAGTDHIPSEIGTPGGAQVKVMAGETNFTQTTAPGIYTLPGTVAGKVSGFAVNLDGAESRTAPLPADELERLGAPVAHPGLTGARETGHKVRLQNSELENRQKLWRWFLLAALAVLILETWLAGRTGRQLAGPLAETATIKA